MIKENINKIDFQLKNEFDDVNIIEKSTKGEFLFEINASKVININGEPKKVSIKLDIKKESLNKDIFNWDYYIDTNDLNSDRIKKTSLVETIQNDILDIFEKKKFSKDYLDKLESFIPKEEEVIIEKESQFNNKIQSIFDSFEISDVLKNEKKYVDGVHENTIIVEKKLSPENKYIFDMNLKSAGYEDIEYVDNKITIKYYS